MTNDNHIALLQDMAIFGGVKPETLEFLLSRCRVVTIPKDAYFFREREVGDTLFVLETGSADVIKSWNGEERVLQTLQAGDCFGEMAVIDHCERSASVRASEDCQAIRMSSGDLHQLYAHDLKQFTLIQMNMGREVSRRLRDADHRLFAAMMQSRK